MRTNRLMRCTPAHQHTTPQRHHHPHQLRRDGPLWLPQHAFPQVRERGAFRRVKKGRRRRRRLFDRQVCAIPQFKHDILHVVACAVRRRCCAACCRGGCCAGGRRRCALLALFVVLLHSHPHILFLLRFLFPAAPFLLSLRWCCFAPAVVAAVAAAAVAQHARLLCCVDER